MNISLHIKALLYRHDCVVVPGFGAFLAQYHSAKVDAENHLFFPPSRKITFNAQLKNNDGLLIKHLEQEEALNYAEAQKAIHQYVDDINLALTNENKLQFKGIGTFIYQNNEQLVFQPEENNFLLSSFGLTNFKNEALSRDLPKQQNETQPTKVIPFIEKEKSTPNYLKYAAVGLISLGLASAFGLNWYTTKVEKHNLYVQKQAQQEVQNTIENAVFSITEPLPTLQIKKAAKIIESEKHMHIIAGAFREEANALKKLEQLQQQGFDARLVGKNKYGLHQVAFSSYANVDEAKLALRKIKNNQLPSAWLLID